MYCSHCGCKLPEGSLYCNMCGTPLEKTTDTPTAVSLESPQTAKGSDDSNDIADTANTESITPAPATDQSSSTTQRILSFIKPYRKIVISCTVIVIFALCMLTYCNSKNYLEDRLTGNDTWHCRKYEPSTEYTNGYSYYVILQFHGDGTVDIEEWIEGYDHEWYRESSQEGDWSILRNNVLHLEFSYKEDYLKYTKEWSVNSNQLILDEDTYYEGVPESLREAFDEYHN